jgi:site-specific DNA-cytosine methylase
LISSAGLAARHSAWCRLAGIFVSLQMLILLAAPLIGRTCLATSSPQTFALWTRTRCWALPTSHLDLLFAGPPCQGFSIIGSRVVWDKRNNLFKEVLRLASESQPRCVVIENVPGLVTLARGAYLHAILEGLSAAGYEAACAELLAAQYGAPQMRWRLIIIGWRKDLGIPAGYGFPRPTVGTAEIGDLLPNCTIPPGQLEGFVTTAEAISDLPPVAAGGEGTHYVGPPVGPYQEMMRAGLTSELSNHYAARLSAANLTRLAHIKPGQDWRDLPRDLLPSSMQRALRKDHTRRAPRGSSHTAPLPVGRGSLQANTGSAGCVRDRLFACRARPAPGTRTQRMRSPPGSAPPKTSAARRRWGRGSRADGRRPYQALALQATCRHRARDRPVRRVRASYRERFRNSRL